MVSAVVMLQYKKSFFFFVSCLQDLDAALPIIEKYKDHLVAVGEVKIQCLCCDLNSSFLSGISFSYIHVTVNSFSFFYFVTGWFGFYTQICQQ